MKVLEAAELLVDVGVALHLLGARIRASLLTTFLRIRIRTRYIVSFRISQHQENQWRQI